MKVIETGFQKRTWIIHKCAVSIQNKISSAEMNHIKKQKYAKSDKDLKLQYITGDSLVACFHPEHTYCTQKVENGKKCSSMQQCSFTEAVKWHKGFSWVLKSGHWGQEEI